MTAPAMPGPARLVSRSLAHLERRGYTRTEARRAVCDVIEALGASEASWPPWATDWLRQLWLAAAGKLPDAPPGNPAAKAGEALRAETGQP